jgi:hypothetical protein
MKKKIFISIIAFNLLISLSYAGHSKEILAQAKKNVKERYKAEDKESDWPFIYRPKEDKEADYEAEAQRLEALPGHSEEILAQAKKNVEERYNQEQIESGDDFIYRPAEVKAADIENEAQRLEAEAQRQAEIENEEQKRIAIQTLINEDNQPEWHVKIKVNEPDFNAAEFNKQREADKLEQQRRLEKQQEIDAWKKETEELNKIYEKERQDWEEAERLKALQLQQEEAERVKIEEEQARIEAERERIEEEQARIEAARKDEMRQKQLAEYEANLQKRRAEYEAQEDARQKEAAIYKEKKEALEAGGLQWFQVFDYIAQYPDFSAEKILELHALETQKQTEEFNKVRTIYVLEDAGLDQEQARSIVDTHPSLTADELLHITQDQTWIIRNFMDEGKSFDETMNMLKSSDFNLEKYLDELEKIKKKKYERELREETEKAKKTLISKGKTPEEIETILQGEEFDPYEFNRDQEELSKATETLKYQGKTAEEIEAILQSEGFDAYIFNQEIEEATQELKSRGVPDEEINRIIREKDHNAYNFSHEPKYLDLTVTISPF